LTHFETSYWWPLPRTDKRSHRINGPKKDSARPQAQAAKSKINKNVSGSRGKDKEKKKIPFSKKPSTAPIVALPIL